MGLVVKDRFLCFEKGRIQKGRMRYARTDEKYKFQVKISIFYHLLLLFSLFYDSLPNFINILTNAAK